MTLSKSIRLTHEYDDAARYDAEYGRYEGDFAFFQGFCEKRERYTRILDLGCGTGRLTLKLAERGQSVIGLDDSVAMLKRAQKKDVAKCIHWVHGNLCDFDLGAAVDLITMTGNTFQALLTTMDQQRMLRCVKKHMKVGSQFAFNTRNSTPHHVFTNDIFEAWHTFTDQHGHLVTVSGRQSYDPKTQIMTYETKRAYLDHTTLSPLEIRFTPYEDLMMLLQSAGFKVLNIYGDFDKTPFTSGSNAIICVCSI